MAKNCPMCASAASLYHPGTIDPKQFFEQGVAYTVAAGGDKDRLPIYRCCACGHGFTPIDFDPQIIVRWYAGYQVDHIFLAQEVARRKTGKEVLESIEAVADPGAKRALRSSERAPGLTPPRLLDVGAGPGLFLSEAAARGWAVTGLEPSAWAVEHAQKQLQIPNMRQGDITILYTFPSQSFDCLVAFDVIEHLVDPTNFLQQVSRILKPGGLLVMTTPRFDSFLARLMGRRWYCIFPAHIHYFTRRSLHTALREADFSVTLEKTHTRYLGLGYLWQRLLDFLNIKPLPVNSTTHGPIIPVNYGDEFEIYARKN